FGVFPRPPALAGSDAQKLYGNALAMDPAESAYRVLRDLSQRAGVTEPSLAAVKTVLSEHDLTTAQCDRLMDRLRATYRFGTRSTPYQVFCTMIGKNGF